MPKHHTNLTQPPREDCYGFYGTLRANGEGAEAALTEKQLDQLWDEGMRQAARVLRERDQQVVRNFLRSSAGRHLADQVFNHAYPRSTYQALRRAVAAALEERSARTNKLIWKKSFNAVKKSTLDGTWTD